MHRTFLIRFSTTFLVLLHYVCINPQPVLSHALHPESIDRYAEITVTPNRLVLIYQVILGINPTERASKALDPNNDGTITDEERNTYLQQISQEYIEGQKIYLGDVELKTTYQIGDVYSAYGHNGIRVIRIDIGFICDLPSDIPRETHLKFSYEDQTMKQRVGWKQIQLFTRNGVKYEGHIPYTEYKPFDYEILNTKGFSPATDSITGEILLPANENNGEIAPIKLPERSMEAVKVESSLDTVILVGVSFLLLFFIIAVAFRLRR